MGEKEFLKYIQNAADDILISEEPIRIISNYDTDGLTAASILIKAFIRKKKPFAVSIIKQLTKKVLNELSFEDYKTLVFCDLGSTAISEFNTLFKDKKIFVLDHHQINQEIKLEKGFHITPILFDINGTSEISAAGISYLFSKALDEENKDSAYLAIIGAIGDCQEDNGFKGINQLILEDAKDKIDIKNGLRMFGLYSRPLHKVLQYTTDPYIPGITGEENNAINFLEEIGIKTKRNGSWVKFSDLEENEIKILTTSIIIKRSGEERSGDIFGLQYIINHEEGYLKDAREFSTLLNCCGRLNKASLGIGVCLNDKKSKEKALDLAFDYKKELVKSIEWFHNNRNSKNVIEEKGFIIINAEDYIKDSLIGTITSILSNSNLFDEGSFILSMAHNIDGMTKVSIRMVGKNHNDLNLKEILENICTKIGGETGGHTRAAGALILQEKEEEFIKHARDYFRLLTQEVK